MDCWKFLPWDTLQRSRKWQPTPKSLPGKSQGQRRLAGYSPCSHKRVTHDSVTTYEKETGGLFLLSAHCVWDFMHALHIAWVLNLWELKVTSAKVNSPLSTILKPWPAFAVWPNSVFLNPWFEFFFCIIFATVGGLWPMSLLKTGWVFSVIWGKWVYKLYSAHVHITLVYLHT